MAKPKKAKSLFDKVKEIDPGFASEVFSLKENELDAKLVTMAKHRSEIEDAQKNDDDLASAKENVKTLNSTYSEPLKAIKMKTKLIIDVLKSRTEG